MKVVNVGREHTVNVANAGMENFPKVVNAGKETMAQIINAVKERMALVVNAGKDMVNTFTEKLNMLKEIKAELKAARQFHEKNQNKKTKDKSYPEEFTTRQAVRAFEMLDTCVSTAAAVVSKISFAGIFDAIKGKLIRMYDALKISLRTRFIPWTKTVRTWTTERVGVKLAVWFLTGLSRVPPEYLNKLPINVNGYSVHSLAPNIADGFLLSIVGASMLMILMGIFRKDEFAATHKILNVPEGLDVLIRLPKVESMSEVKFTFDAYWNQIWIKADKHGHRELIEVPKCKVGVKQWAEPSPVFLDGEETILVELRPAGVAKKAQNHTVQDEPKPKVTADKVTSVARTSTPFAPVTNRPAAVRKTNSLNARATKTRR